MTAAVTREWNSGSASLRPFIPSDAGAYLYFATERESSLSWRHRGTTPSADQMLGSLWTGAEVVLVGSVSGKVVGFYVLYDVDYRNAHGYVAVLQDPALSGLGGAFGPLALFLDYVFGEFPFVKLYFMSDEVAAARYASSVTSGLLTDEARFRGHFQHEQGVFSDCYVRALRRETWIVSRFSEHSNDG